MTDILVKGLRGLVQIYWILQALDLMQIGHIAAYNGVLKDTIAFNIQVDCRIGQASPVVNTDYLCAAGNPQNVVDIALGNLILTGLLVMEG